MIALARYWAICGQRMEGFQWCQRFTSMLDTSTPVDVRAGLLGVAGLFRRVFTIEDTWRPKPDRTGLEDIFRGIGRKPAECLFIGDRYDIDLRLPAALGCAVFLVSTTEELFHLCTLMTEENV